MASDDKDLRRQGRARRASLGQHDAQRGPTPDEHPRAAATHDGPPAQKDASSSRSPSGQNKDIISAALKASEDLLRDFVNEDGLDADKAAALAHPQKTNPSRPQRPGRRGSRLFGTDKARWKRKGSGIKKSPGMASSASAVPVRPAVLRKGERLDESALHTSHTPEHNASQSSAYAHHPNAEYQYAATLPDAKQAKASDSLLDELISFDTELNVGPDPIPDHHHDSHSAYNAINDISSIPLDRDPNSDEISAPSVSIHPSPNNSSLPGAHHDPFALEPNYAELSGHQPIRTTSLMQPTGAPHSSNAPSISDIDALPIPQGFGDDLGPPQGFGPVDPSSPPLLSLDDNSADLDDPVVLEAESPLLDATALADFGFDESDDIDAYFLDEEDDGLPLHEEHLADDIFNAPSKGDVAQRDDYSDIAGHLHELAAPYDADIVFNNDSASLDEVVLQELKQEPPPASRSSTSSIDYASVNEVVWDVMEEVVGGRLIEFEEHIIQRLERRMQNMALDSSLGAKSSPPSLSIPALTPNRIHSTNRAVVRHSDSHSPAILPQDWGKKDTAPETTPEDERLRFFFEIMKRRGANELHLHVGAHPIIRIQGVIEALRLRTLRREDWTRLLRPICPPGKWDQWRSTGDVDFIHESTHGRYHVNMLRQRQGGGAVLRRIPDQAPRLRDLRIPSHLEKLADLRGGLCLFSGPYGSGTSNTIAALVSLINSRHAHRIITIEDPIDFVHSPDQAIIHQRVIGVHAATFAEALGDALREAPEVIVVAELIDLATINMAIEAARAGILVYATVRRRTVVETLRALIEVFPDEDQPRMRSQLADVLRVVVCQQLIERLSGGRVPAIELLINTVDAGRMIRHDDFDMLEKVMDESPHLGMERMDPSLAALVQRDEISEEAALARAISPVELYKLIHGVEEEALHDEDVDDDHHEPLDDLVHHDEALEGGELASEPNAAPSRSSSFSSHTEEPPFDED